MTTVTSAKVCIFSITRRMGCLFEDLWVGNSNKEALPVLWRAISGLQTG